MYKMLTLSCNQHVLYTKAPCNILARSKLDALLAFGDAAGDDASSLPNLAAVLRMQTERKKGVKTHEWYGHPHNQYFEGKIKAMMRGGGAIIEYPGHAGQETEITKVELDAAIDARKHATWPKMVTKVKAGIGYLRDRLTGQCQDSYDCSNMYEVLRLVQVFNPTFADAQKIDNTFVDSFSIIPPLADLRPTWCPSSSASCLRTS